MDDETKSRVRQELLEARIIIPLGATLGLMVCLMKFQGWF